MAGVYWQGADGNYYVKAAGMNGVQKFAPGPNGGPLFTPYSLNFINGLSQIADPNAPAKPTSAPSNPTGGGSSGPTTQDKSGDILVNNAGLSSVDSQTSSGIQRINDALNSVLGSYDTESKNNEASYTDQSNTNQNQLQKNKETSLLNAAQGRQGLFGTLASLGALNGSGITLANDAVRKGANEDLSAGADTFANNQSGLDTAIGAFRNANDERKKEANTAAGNARTNATNAGAVSKQKFYSNLSNDYAAEGDNANRDHFANLAASLYPEIATTALPDANIGYTPAAFTPGTLGNYLVQGNNTTVSSAPPPTGSGTPGLIASNTKKKQLVPA